MREKETLFHKTPEEAFASWQKRLAEINNQILRAAVCQPSIYQHFLVGLAQYLDDFMTPYFIAQDAFVATEREKLTETPLPKSMSDYTELLLFNLQVAQKGAKSTLQAINEFHADKIKEMGAAWLATLFEDGNAPQIGEFFEETAEMLRQTVVDYPQAIRDIGGEYGFHFENDGFVKSDETDRFYLYQVLPQDPKTEVRMGEKPVLIVHPYVLGPNILCFLPAEKKSYVHAFANQGTPTYVRIMKDIAVTEAVQVMTGEQDAQDTRRFCELLFKKHGRKVTLNGFCQGGFIAALELLSGVLDGLVDAFITCVSPMDGTRSIALVEYLQHLPPRFRDLGYAVRTLPNGNRIVDGKVMSWVYKLKSMEKEAPLFTFYRDLKMFDKPGLVKIGKTAAAINHWLIYDRNDLPESITKLSFDSYTIPVAKDGTLPVKLFGKALNFKRLASRDVKMLICYAQTDDLVDKETALAPLDFIEAEVTEFPKGHGAIATSWSNPNTECALHKTFNGFRGPVRFHLDLEKETKKS